ncbi:MAG: M60 family metallopeptidase, partial [Anaerolineae bacterium]
VVAFGHGGYFSGASLLVADTGRLLENAVRWAAAQGTSRIRVGAIATPDAAAYLTSRGLDVDAATIADLSGYDAVLWAPWDHGEDDVALLRDYLAAGGGIVMAATGWGWAQLHPGQDLRTAFAGNRLLASAGIQWANSYLRRTSGEGYGATEEPTPLAHAGRSLDAAYAMAAGDASLDADQRRQVFTTIRRALGCLPLGDTELLPRLRDLAAAPDMVVVPTHLQPVTEAEVLRRLAVLVQTYDAQTLPPEQVRAHPAARVFPGHTPDAAPRVGVTITVDPSVPRWHSTGLYAPAGEVLTVRVPEAASTAGLAARIGAHSDTLWHKDEWRRMPEISRRFRLSAAETPIASAFGGLVYLEVPAGMSAAPFDVEVDGGVVAPLFVLGRTTPADWRAVIRSRPAPWGELASGNMVVTVPSAALRDLDDPEAVMAIWDEILGLDAYLAAWPEEARRYPERIVTDEQISAGYMHAGYPIMTHLDQSSNVVDAAHLSGGNWGLFHEVGHNHQSGDWTFAGTGEVTVNLFTLYVYDKVAGIPPEDHPQGSAAARAEQMARYDFRHPDFEQWKREPFLALVSYIELQQAFGWDAYREVFAEYRALPAEDRPRDDAAKRDQWLVRFSRHVGRNLGPFYAAWGVPTSASARQAVADLPVWMPDELLDLLPGPPVLYLPVALGTSALPRSTP